MPFKMQRTIKVLKDLYQQGCIQDNSSLIITYISLLQNSFHDRNEMWDFPNSVTALSVHNDLQKDFSIHFLPFECGTSVLFITSENLHLFNISPADTINNKGTVICPYTIKCWSLFHILMYLISFSSR